MLRGISLRPVGYCTFVFYHVGGDNVGSRVVFLLLSPKSSAPRAKKIGTWKYACASASIDFGSLEEDVT